MTQWTIGPAVCGLPLLAGCASYTPSAPPVPEPTPADWQVNDDLAVAVDAYVDEERQKSTFDADLDEADVIALLVSVENRDERKMVVRTSDMMLLLPGDRAMAPSGVTTAVNKIGERGSVVGATIAFGIIGALAASSAEDKARSARTADYTEKSFTDVTLGQDESAHGFVFFIPPRGTEPFDEATLRVRFVDFDTATSRTVEVALSGLGYEETKEDEKKKTDYE